MSNEFEHDRKRELIRAASEVICAAIQQRWERPFREGSIADSAEKFLINEFRAREQG